MEVKVTDHVKAAIKPPVNSKVGSDILCNHVCQYAQKKSQEVLYTNLQDKN